MCTHYKYHAHTHTHPNLKKMNEIILQIIPDRRRTIPFNTGIMYIDLVNAIQLELNAEIFHL